MRPRRGPRRARSPCRSPQLLMRSAAARKGPAGGRGPPILQRRGSAKSPAARVPLVPRRRRLEARVVRAPVRYLELERRTLPLRGVDEPQMAAMHADDLRGDREPEPRAALPLRAGERLEKMVARLLRHAGAV